MKKYNRHLILKGSNVKNALIKLNKISKDAILFVVDKNDKLIGSLTDGDIRRSLLKGHDIESKIDDIIQPNPKYIRKSNYKIRDIVELRKNNYRIIPVVDDDDRIVNILNFRFLKSFLPIDVVIMAGGRGQRLKPLTDKLPKPLLMVGDKPIIEHNIDRLKKFGIEDVWISINYLGDMIEQYFGSRMEKDININYVREVIPSGTIAAVSTINNFKNDYILVTNSDLLTNIDFEQFFIEFLKQNADLAILAIPYKVNVPYAVLDSKNGKVKNLVEKPTFTYFSNGGVYLFKRELINLIPKNKFYNATDFLEDLIKNNFNVISFPFSGYWLDIGRHEDYKKAQMDIYTEKF